MRYFVLAMALTFIVPPVAALAANKPARVKTKARRGKFKPQKPKKIKAHSRAN
jgi:hypothetical protein